MDEDEKDITERIVRHMVDTAKAILSGELSLERENFERAESCPIRKQHVGNGGKDRGKFINTLALRGYYSLWRCDGCGYMYKRGANPESVKRFKEALDRTMF